MKPIEERVVSLDLAKRLKESGFPQECLFYWTDISGGFFVFKKTRGFNIKDPRQEKLKEYYYAAPLADEIMDELPEELVKGDISFHILLERLGGKYAFEYIGGNEGQVIAENDNDHEDVWDKKPANALAKFWLYLKENKLI